MRCVDAPLTAIVAHLRERVAAGDPAPTIDVPDPDLGAGRFAGESIPRPDGAWIHRPLRVWVELADALGLRLRTPRSGPAPDLVRLTFEVLAPERPRPRGPVTERYGTASPFSRVHKDEDPGFVVDLQLALARARLPAAPRVLVLGINTGIEVSLMQRLDSALAAAHFVGIDHAASALEVARARLDPRRVTLVEADLNDLPALDLEPFDLAVAIGVLHSPGVDDRSLLRHLVQDRLRPQGAIVLGYPNCRYRDGEVSYGARTKNYREPELSLLLQDVAFARRYLQQHRRKVHVTGRHYIFVTGVRLDAPNVSCVQV